MSHRTALLASFALTVVMALGIFATRDRLFETGASADSNVSPTATTLSETTAIETTNGAQRVIEVTLPQPTPVSINPERDDEDDHDDDEHEENDDD